MAKQNINVNNRFDPPELRQKKCLTVPSEVKPIRHCFDCFKFCIPCHYVTLFSLHQLQNATMQ